MSGNYRYILEGPFRVNRCRFAISDGRPLPPQQLLATPVAVARAVDQPHPIRRRA